MQKTKIEWTDYTWNPIKGICPTGCWYCYARRMYQRFGWDSEVKLDEELFGSCQDAFAPNINVYEKFERIKSGSKIFICSMFELFHPQVPREWRDAIFQAIKEHPQHIFQILTKFPQNIDRPIPDNVWLGVSITQNRDIHRVKKLLRKQAKVKFVSIEPFLKPIYILSSEFLRKMDWIILGKLTGYGKKYAPLRTWIEGFEAFAKAMDIPLFMKDNLKGIWEEPLIQEMPE